MARVILASACAALLLGCGARDRPADAQRPSSAAAAAAGSEADEINPRLLRRFKPVAGAPAAEPVNADRVILGRYLFYEKRLSSNGQIACSHCHALTRFGIDGQPTSVGAGGIRGHRNSPSVFNAATHIAQFWDGRASNVEEQATQPIMNPTEMAMPNEEAVTRVLRRIPTYVRLFNQAFPGESKPISMKNVGEAIGAFERGLVTVSRWDKFIAGDMTVLTAAEKHGLRVFLDVGCVTCHTGPQVGGTMLQKLGAVIPWPDQEDLGRVAVTRMPSDRMVFKVPSLKNVDRTAPYFHNGGTTNLQDAIRLMGHYQLGIDLTPDEVQSISIWMGSMTGEIAPAYIAPPRPPEESPAPAVQAAAP
ncbi:MAG: cytochrome c peroxidase [Pseudomonadota bacterium]